MVEVTPSSFHQQATRGTVPIDPGQAAIGLRPVTRLGVEHGVDIGPPEALTAGMLPPPRQFTQAVVVKPLMTVVEVTAGVAIFGTIGGRAVTP